MTRPAHRNRGERGTTLLEVLIAGVVMVVTVTGFVATANVASSSSALAHRTTSLALLRSGAIDRLSVMPRTSIAALATAGTWVAESCYDHEGTRVANNPTLSTGFSCPTATTRYSTHVSASANGTTPQWAVRVFVQKTDPGCTPANRYGSSACLAADLLLTD